jgi:leucyl/phenylalanyl-tRNA---protein transferase
MIFALGKALLFPNPELAEEDGLLAIGGDLSAERLLLAYQQGIFPWYSEGEPILWYSPHERFVILPNELHISHSMKKVLQSGKFTVTFDQAFEQVINHCAAMKRKGQHSTWITNDMKAAYITLHEKGIAHSVESWCDGTLAGGLYGVVVGKVFCGESMFSLLPNASKVALARLCESQEYDLIDCQMNTPHLERMGGKYIGRKEYMEYVGIRLNP